MLRWILGARGTHGSAEVKLAKWGSVTELG